MPASIKTVALASRSLTPKENKIDKVVESIITGEIEVSDRKASNECLTGVMERLSDNNEFRSVIASENKLYGTGTGEIPSPLDWEKVSEICQTSDSDALLVLEMFDSDSDMLAFPKILMPEPQTRDERTFNIRMYWRLYDPSLRQIIDQYECTREVTFVGNGRTATVPPKALHGAAYSGGLEYIERFLPGLLIADRTIYKKGKGRLKNNFKAAYRFVEVDDWERAADYWEEVIQLNDENIGRAYLNMAVYFEKVGNIEEAIRFAQIAYSEYGIKQARDYEYALRNLKNSPLIVS